MVSNARVLFVGLLAAGCGPSQQPVAADGSGTGDVTGSTTTGPLPDSGSETGGQVDCAVASRVIDGDVTITTADDFAALGDVVAITGDLSIENTSLVELSGASCLDSVGTLFINRNEVLERVDEAFARLRTADRLFVSDNPVLVSVAGLGALERIEDRTYLTGNDSLTDLGLVRLEYVGETFNISDNPSLVSLASLAVLGEVTYSLRIDNCDGLVDLGGLGSLTIAGGLTVENNDGLTSLVGSSLATVGARGLWIENNPQLPTLVGLESLTTVEGTVDILENASLESLEGLGGLTTVFEGDLGGNFSRLSIRHNSSLASLDGLEQLATVEPMLHLCDNMVLTDLTAIEGVTQVGQFVVIYNDALDDTAVMANPLTALSTLPAKIDANGELAPMWWNKPVCPWPDDGVCDGSLDYEGDVQSSCEQDCCEPGGPTRLCLDETDSEGDCPGPIGPP